MLARAWDRTLATLVATGYAAMVVVGFAQVLSRFVFERPLSWSEELVRYVFVWSVFLTAAIAFTQDLHIRIDFVTARCPPRVQRALGLVSWACVLLGLLILLVLGLELVSSPSVWRQKSPAMEIPMAVPYAALPVGAVVMLVNALRAARRAWRGEAAPASDARVEIA